MLLHLTDHSSEPMHKQISRQLIERILTGDLVENGKLMAPRALARAQHVSVSTVERVYAELVDLELILQKEGRGYFVNSLSVEKKQEIAMQLLSSDASPLNIVKNVSEMLVSVFDPSKLTSVFADSLKQYFLSKDVFFILTQKDGALQFFPQNAFKGLDEVRPSDDFLQKLRETKLPVAVETLCPGDGKSAVCRMLLEKNVKLVAPVVSEEKLRGFIALTEKKTGAGYVYSDMMLLSVLARQFATALTVATMYMDTLEKRQLDEELSMARQIQQDLLPRELPDDEDFQIAASSEPSKAVGGDFYDYLPLDENRFGLVIADACGKGMPAAMLISQIQAILKSEARTGASISEIMTNMNKHLLRYTSARNFATLFFGIFNRKTMTLEFANAGHNNPILAKSDGKSELLQTTGPALGILHETEFATEIVQLERGDNLLLYSDGVTETMNAASDEFGEDKLSQTFSANLDKPAEALIQEILKEVNEFQHSSALPDDRTVMVLKVSK